MKIYTFVDDSWYDNPACDCCEGDWMECYNSDDTDHSLGSAHSTEDCWQQVIISEIGRWNIPEDYETQLYEMSLDELKQEAQNLNISSMRARKLVCGVGVNDADYTVDIRELVNGKQKLVWLCPFYDKWTSMLKRGYSKNFKERCPTYNGVTVCEEWLTFSNFKAWMETQDWKGKELDKDILVKGNKIYSPETCVFVDKIINNFIIERGNDRGEYPIGVNFHKASGSFVAQCSNPFTGKREHLGLYCTPEQAHKTWLARKLEFAYMLAAEQTDKRIAKALIDKYSNYEEMLNE